LFYESIQKKKTILVTGYVHDNNLKFLLERVYKIRGLYDGSKATYESNDYKFIVYLGLESGNFDKNQFRETCRSIKRLTAIIFCENLNPRSNNLKGNLEELRLSFEADELRKKLHVFFTFGTSKASS
jgi:hypothetical protein